MRLKLVLPLVLAALAGPALATPEAALPSLAAVTGVSADDVLNVRAAPDANAPIVGSLAPDARGFEVTGFDPSGRWARIGMGEISGWASGRFLVLDRGTWRNGALPAALTCIGTEPFWSLRHDDGRMSLSMPDRDERRLDLRAILDRGLQEDAMRSLIAGDGQGRLTAVIRPEACSDGMSDRDFGLSATVILDGQGQSSRMLTGCCSVAR